MEKPTKNSSQAPKLAITRKNNKEEYKGEIITRAVFIGRYSPFHKGHLAIMQQKIDTGVPLLILVRDTDFDLYTAEERKQMIEAAMENMNADAEVMIIPDIESVNYGRGVGYGINELEVPENIKAISATDIRKRMAEGDESWKEFMPDGTHAVMEEINTKRKEE